MPKNILALALALAWSASTAAEPMVRIDNPALPEPAPRELPEGHARLFTDADLAPYFASPPEVAAKKLFDAGRYRDALAALQKLKPTPAVKYVSGLCLLHLSRGPEAAQLFANLATELPALADRCHIHAAVAFEDAGQLERAEAEYAAVDPCAVVWSDAQLGLARVRKARHDTLGALSAAAALANRPWSSPGRDLQAEALVFIAQVSQASGDRETARLANLKIWAEHPLAKIADPALATAKALGAKEPANDLKLRRAEVLLDANRNDQAIAALKPLLATWKLPEANACKTHFLYGKAMRKQRQHADALDALEPVISQCGADAALRAKALYVAGSSGSIVAPARGIAAYTTLATDYPSHSFADDALFFAADIEQKAGRTDDAEATLRRLADEPAYRDGDFRPEGLFRLFWIARQKNQPERGLTILERIINEYSDTRPAETERAEYWRARTFTELGRHDEADAAYTALVQAHPTSYYALMARSRLGECHPLRAQAALQAIAALPQPTDEALEPGKLRDDHHFAAAIELFRLGLLEESADELLAVPREKLRHDESDALRLLVQLIARAGNPRAASAVARTELADELSRAPTASSLNLWLAAYPLAFRDEVQKTCGLAQIEPDLFQALIREESALDPHIISWAGAVGLAQLMPGTAKELARGLKIKQRIDLDTLQDPELNLRLGSAYVGQLLKRFNGDPALALAAYNAGAGAVSKWLGDRGGEDLDAFVEEIPIAETRGYVKRVLQTFNTYQILYTRKAEATLPRSPLPPPPAKPKKGPAVKVGMASWQ